MTGTRQVLLELICYASNLGKPAVLRLRAEHIAELCTRELIEKHEDGYWITDLGREQCKHQRVHGRDSHSLAVDPVPKRVQGGYLGDGSAWEESGARRRVEAC